MEKDYTIVKGNDVLPPAAGQLATNFRHRISGGFELIFTADTPEGHDALQTIRLWAQQNPSVKITKADRDTRGRLIRYAFILRS